MGWDTLARFPKEVLPKRLHTLVPNTVHNSWLTPQIAADANHVTWRCWLLALCLVAASPLILHVAATIHMCERVQVPAGVGDDVCWCCACADRSARCVCKDLLLFGGMNTPAENVNSTIYRLGGWGEAGGREWVGGRQGRCMLGEELLIGGSTTKLWRMLRTCWTGCALVK